MSKVIAVQEEQLKMLKEKYKSTAPQVSTPQNNADILSGSLGVDMVAPGVTPPTIDMESQVVNLNSSVQPSVIQPDVTNQIFGSTPTVVESTPTPIIPEPNLFAPSAENTNVESPIASVPSSLDVPFQEPIINSAAPVNVMSDEAYVNHINTLEDKITTLLTLCNEIDMDIKKIKEQFAQKSGVNLVENSKVSESAEKIETTVPSTMSNFSIESAGGNIFDVQSQQLNKDETLVIPRDFMDNAIAELQNGTSK